MPTVEASDHAYQLAESDRDVELPEDTSNGLAAGGDGAVSIITGTDMGPVDVAVQAHDVPPAVGLAEWDDVVEVSVTVVDEPLEQHLIQIWPAAVGAPQVLKATDEFGRLWSGQP